MLRRSIGPERPPRFLPLPEPAAMLSTGVCATVVWVHFPPFDPFVGRRTYYDAGDREVPMFLVSPVPFVTLLFGPLGPLTSVVPRPGLGD